MKIVYIANTEIPAKSANSINIMKMCQAFSANHHDVTLIIPDKNDSAVDSGCIFDYYGVTPCFRIVRLPWRKTIKGKTYIYALQAAVAAKKAKPDVVYSRFIGGCYCSALLGLQIVYEAHMPDAAFGSIELFLAGRLIRSRQLRRLVVISAALRQYYLEKYLPTLAQRILVAPDGADPVDTTRVAQHLTAAAALQVGYLGQLYPGKGIELIIALAAQCPWAEFHIVGGYPDAIEHWRTRSAGAGNISFHGHLPHGRTTQVLAGFDVVLAPYQRRVEVHGGGGDIAQWMSPLKIFEYMAAGKPIVCSALPVLQEILQNGNTAWLCDPDDVTQWRQALQTLKNAPLLRQRLGENARREFLQRYTWQARARSILDDILV
jgi:glycosyltransferase involved in cell wall biosynthesis